MLSNDGFVKILGVETYVVGDVGLLVVGQGI